MSRLPVLLPFLLAAPHLFGAGGPAPGAGWRDADRDGRMSPYENPALPPEQRVDDLLSRMTPAEKLGQLNQRLLSADSLVRWHHELENGEIGGMLPDAPVVNDARLRNAVQRLAADKSPHGIPVMLGFDTIHGFRTVFPIPLAQACSWDDGLVRKTSEVAARESAAAGIDWIFAPMCDIARDARWGRVAEGFGEDPWLTSKFVAAAVHGFQGEKVGAPDRVVACLKHFAGYGAAEAGRDYATVEISGRTMRDVYLPPFRAGVEAGARTVMTAFHSNNGVPATGDRGAIDGILRKEWGFSGFVVSDWNSVSELQQHGFAADAAASARICLNAGLDMEMISACYADTLPRLLDDGDVKRDAVDAAVRRILRVKFECGLFEHPYADESLAATAFLRPDAVALAREAVAKSCVLLQNRAGALPLSPATCGKVALIGPLGDDADEMLGTWQGQGKSADVVTLAYSLRRVFGAERVTVARGCPLSGSIKTRTATDGSIIVMSPAELAEQREFDEAVTAAGKSDVVVMALGEPRGWSGENASRTALSLSGRQEELFEAVCATGRPVIVVLFTGRPLAIPAIRDKAAAILLAWHPGVQAGPGITDLLTGATEPTARLAITLPRSVGQCPIYYNHPNTGRPQYADYKDSPGSPLYPFGFGLGYADFTYGAVKLERAGVRANGVVTASAEIKNTSSRAGETVAQFYIRCFADENGVRPVRELRDFRRVRLAPGETKRVTFSLPAVAFARPGTVDGKPAPYAGSYRVWIAPDSARGAFADLVIEK